MPERPVLHPVAAFLGIVAFLLAVLSIGEYYGYIGPATLGGITYLGMGFFTALATIAAIAMYAFEDREADNDRETYRRRSRRDRDD